MIFPILAEFIGTFVFVSVILSVSQPIPIAVALLSAIYFAGHISGGHFNPAVSTVFLANGTITAKKYSGYIVAQILGALCALYFNKLTTTAAVKR